MKLIHSCNNT